MTHAASLRSARLRRVLAVLADGEPHSSLEIVTKARTMAPSACVSELRIRGAAIGCEMRVEDGARRWYYTMTRAPVLPEAPAPLPETPDPHCPPGEAEGAPGRRGALPPAPAATNAPTDE